MGAKPRTKSIKRRTVGRVLAVVPRRIESVLRDGGRTRCEEEALMLLELSLRVLEAAADKRAACALLATPSRIRRPAQRRMREYLDGRLGHEL